MPGSDVRDIGTELRRAGIAPRAVRRILAEMADHHEDLMAALAAQGRHGAEAQALAARQLGDARTIAAVAAAQQELHGWRRRWPRAANVILPVASFAAQPVMAGLQKGPLIARWAACLVLSAGFTAALMLALQLSIRLD